DRAGHKLAFLRIRVRGWTDAVKRVLHCQRRNLDHFEARRSIAKQPHGAGDVAAPPHEPVAARREAVNEFMEHAAEARKALEGPELEKLVQEEGRRLARCGPGPCEEGERGVERGAGAGL